MKGISFNLINGQIYGLLGPNGAGKSTTFSIVTKFLEETSGNVNYKNQINE